MLIAGVSLELRTHNGAAEVGLLTEFCSQKVFCIHPPSRTRSHTHLNSYINTHAQAVE